MNCPQKAAMIPIRIAPDIALHRTCFGRNIAKAHVTDSRIKVRKDERCDDFVVALEPGGWWNAGGRG